MAVTLQRRDGRRHADGEWGKSRRSEPKSGQGGAVHESKNSRSFGSWILGSRLAFAFFSSTPAAPQDRKSTRLNSSHGYISYAVFCLKKKKKKQKKYIFYEMKRRVVHRKSN